jgi:hypothetical protein
MFRSGNVSPDRNFSALPGASTQRSDTIAGMITLDPDAYDAIARHGRSALAWEVLRRDPAYRAAFARLATIPRPGIAVDAGFTARWGLHFP